MNAVAALAATFSRDFAASPVGLVGWMRRGLALLRSLGPYVAIEILLPGGTLIALALWLYRRRLCRADAAASVETIG
jgi:hypothetical protein